MQVVNSFQNVIKDTCSTKRILPLEDGYPSKKKRTKIDWITATQLANYMINDPLCDWLELVHKNGKSKEYDLSPVSKTLGEFMKFQFENGHKFEAEVIDELKKKIEVVHVADNKPSQKLAKTVAKLLKKGVPAIHGAPLYNHTNHTCGVADLLVRSDYLQHIVDYEHLNQEEKTRKASNLSGNYHYVVIDIKHSTLNLSANTTSICKSGRTPAYKAQLQVYNQALGLLQGYTPRYAYLLERRWNNKTRSSFSNGPFNRLGVIDYAGADFSYIKKTTDAINWVKSVRKHWDKWTVNPPSVPELFPNMNVQTSLYYMPNKREIANNIGEITLIRGCGIAHRENAHSQGVMSWKDPRCVSSLLGLKGKSGSIADKILEINRNGNACQQKITSNLFDWKVECDEVYVDFETLSDLCSGRTNVCDQLRQEYVFMIGVGQVKAEKWTYTSFIADACTPDAEWILLEKFTKYLESIGNPKIYFWHAEKIFWSKAITRQYSQGRVLKSLDMCDITRIFKDGPIAIEGCFTYRLKDVASALYKKGLIKAHPISTCTDGVMAMIGAWKYYNEFKNKEVLDDITVYNEFDCKAMCEILEYLRSTTLK
jgi:hypothetical protein